MDLLVQARVNPVDVKTREGQLKALLKYRFPLVLGNDLSGGFRRGRTGHALQEKVVIRVA